MTPDQFFQLYILGILIGTPIMMLILGYRRCSFDMVMAAVLIMFMWPLSLACFVVIGACILPYKLGTSIRRNHNMKKDPYHGYYGN